MSLQGLCLKIHRWLQATGVIGLLHSLHIYADFYDPWNNRNVSSGGFSVWCGPRHDACDIHGFRRSFLLLFIIQTYWPPPCYVVVGWQTQLFYPGGLSFHHYLNCALIVCKKQFRTCNCRLGVVWPTCASKCLEFCIISLIRFRYLLITCIWLLVYIRNLLIECLCYEIAASHWVEILWHTWIQCFEISSLNPCRVLSQVLSWRMCTCAGH